MSWKSSLTLDNLDKIVKIAAYFIGGGLAYFKYFRGRVYSVRLEPKVIGTTFCKDGRTYLTTTTTLKNTGQARAVIAHAPTAIRLFTSTVLPEGSETCSVNWQRLGTFPVYEHHCFLESTESIEEQCFISIPGVEHIALKLEFSVGAGKAEWVTTAIVNISQDKAPKLDLCLDTSKELLDGRGITKTITSAISAGSSASPTGATGAFPTKRLPAASGTRPHQNAHAGEDGTGQPRKTSQSNRNNKSATPKVDGQ